MSPSNRKFVLAYILLVGLPLLGLIGVLRAGRNLAAPAAIRSAVKPVANPTIPAASEPSRPESRNQPEGQPQGRAAGMPNLFTLVLQLAVVLTACRLTGALFRKIHQPRVVGEMFAGIMLGPSLLGSLAPSISNYLFPPASLGFLNALSQIGVIIFMFLVGLRTDPKELKGNGRAALLTSHVGITAPFLLAAFLSLYLYPRLSDDSVTFTSFTLFMGAAMSITAFPVLARILRERQLLGTRLGTVAIACAALGDVTGWCILAYIVVLIRAAHSATSIWITVAGILVFGLIMIYGVSRFLRSYEKVYRETGKLTENRMAFLLLLVLMASLCTERLGIHLLFGAFLMGAIMPKEHRFVGYVVDRFETITVTLLLPLFFAFTGLRTNIGLRERPRNVDLLRPDHPGRNHRQIRRLHAGILVDRHASARSRRPRHPDEHARPHGTGNPRHRPRHRRNLSRAIFHDGDDGSRHHLHDLARPKRDLPQILARSRARQSNCPTAHQPSPRRRKPGRLVFRQWLNFKFKLFGAMSFSPMSF